MDKDEQELVTMQTQLTQGLASSDEQHRREVDAAFSMCLDQIQGAASEEQKQQYWQQYDTIKNTSMQECIERNKTIISLYAQQMEELVERVRNAPPIAPVWHLRVLQVAEGAPSHVQSSFMKRTLVASRGEALRAFLQFFLDNPGETEQCSPIELESIRVTHEDSAIFLKGGEIEDRAVYHVDFRTSGQRDLIGHNHVQNEIIGAWVSIGGQFMHRVTEYDAEGRPVRLKEDRVHRPIPKRYTE